MSYSNLHLSAKFFRPPQRTVSCHNGLLDTRTKHIIAQDRLVVAEQRMLDVERRKSSSHLQLLAFEQKQLEKKLSSFQNFDQSLRKHHRSISEANLQYIHQLTQQSQSKFNQNLLSLPKFDHFSDNTSESSDDDDESKSMKKKNKIQPPIVTIIPPDDDVF